MYCFNSFFNCTNFALDGACACTIPFTNIKNDFCFLSGEDGTALAFLAQGGHGCISVTANVAPKLCSDLHQAWREKNIDKAQDLNIK